MYMRNISKNSFRPSIQNNEDTQTSEVKEELRSVVAVFRHADRTPKQKMKMKTNYPGFLAFFED